MAEFELEQGKSQKTLDKAGDGSLSEMAASELADTGTQESTYSKEGFKSALESQDAAQISAQLNGLTAEDAKLIAADSELMGMIANLEGEIRNSVYDRIYVGVQDVDAFCQIFLKRFNVAMGTKYSTDEEALKWAKQLVKNDEKPWTVNGLVRMYALFAKLPAAHLENLKIVLTTNTVDGGYGGAAYSADGVYYFDYDDSDCNTFLDHSEMYHGDIQEDGSTVINENDANYGLNYFDSTAAHELGHVVDFTQSTPFSERPDFLEKSGWKKYDTFNDPNAVTEVVKDTRSYMNRADPEEYVGDKTVSAMVDKIAEFMVKTRINDSSKIDALVDDAIFGDDKVIELNSDGSELTLEAAEARANEILEYWVAHDYTWESDEARDEYYALSDKVKQKNVTNELGASAQAYLNQNNNDEMAFANSLKKAPILEHIARSNYDMDPWFYGEPYGNLSNRQIHSDYHGMAWYSYDMSARANKISNYQFSTPAEEFAELYASYMAADASTRKTPEPLKSWFEANVLPLKEAKPVK